MPTLRSFVTVPPPAWLRMLTALPPRLRHLWAAVVLHALATLCFDSLHRVLERWPTLLATLLIGSLIVWVVPLARRAVLVRVGETIVIAGAVVTLVAVASTGADLLLQR